MILNCYFFLVMLFIYFSYISLFYYFTFNILNDFSFNNINIFINIF